MTNSPDQDLRLAILGVRGIGQVHARIFSELGVKIAAVLGSTEKTAKKATQAINQKYGISAKPFTQLDILLDEAQPHIVSICTPPNLHYEELIQIIDRGLPVFCEKPLFWQHDLTPTMLKESLSFLANHPRRKIYINTGNTVFLDRVLEARGHIEFSDEFFFRFYTQGANQRESIAVDLLPHALSLLLRLTGANYKIRSVIKKTEKHSYRCRFFFGNTLVKFDFQERPKGPKELAFSINGQLFTRIQEGQGTSYRVFIRDEANREKLEMPDPFQHQIELFLQNSNNSAPHQDGFTEAATNLKLMANILWSGK